MEHNCNYNQVDRDTTNATSATYPFSKGNHNHDHDSTCKHSKIKFCQKCDVPYCPDCGREWRENTYYYQSPWAYYQPSTWPEWKYQTIC